MDIRPSQSPAANVSATARSNSGARGSNPAAPREQPVAEIGTRDVDGARGIVLHDLPDSGAEAYVLFETQV